MPRPFRKLMHNELVLAVMLLIAAATTYGGAGWWSCSALAVFVFYEPDPMRDWHDAGGPDL